MTQKNDLKTGRMDSSTKHREEATRKRVGKVDTWLGTKLVVREGHCKHGQEQTPYQTPHVLGTHTRKMNPHHRLALKTTGT